MIKPGDHLEFVWASILCPGARSRFTLVRFEEGNWGRMTKEANHESSSDTSMDCPWSDCGG